MGMSGGLAIEAHIEPVERIGWPYKLLFSPDGRIVEKLFCKNLSERGPAISSVLRYFGPANGQEHWGIPVEREPGNDPTLFSAMHGKPKIP